MTNPANPVKVLVLLDHTTGKTMGVPVYVEQTDHPVNEHYGKVVKVRLCPGHNYPDFYPDSEVSRHLAKGSITEPDHFFEQSIFEPGAPDSMDERGPRFKPPEGLNVAQCTESDTGKVRYYFVYMLEKLDEAETPRIGFAMSQDQSEKFRTWRNDAIHEECRKRKGDVGGAITFHFTPTMAGIVVKASCCICKNEIDLSDYENW